MNEPTSVYFKLQEARTEMLRRPMKKSGKNKFAGYEYFELGDFIPIAHDVFHKVGLCGVFSIFDGVASLQVFESTTGASISFQAPCVMAHNPKGQAIQDLGSTLTYLRRYLWLMALELTENDTVDAITDPHEQGRLNALKTEAKPEPKTEVKVEAKAEVKPDESRVLFVDGLIGLGAQMTTLSELTSLWKANQTQIDDLKKNHKPEYTRLQTEFASLKENFNED